MYQIEKIKLKNCTSIRKRIEFNEAHHNFMIPAPLQHVQTSTFNNEIWVKHNSKSNLFFVLDARDVWKSKLGLILKGKFFSEIDDIDFNERLKFKILLFVQRTPLVRQKILTRE
jgi:hypothetical protein